MLHGRRREWFNGAPRPPHYVKSSTEATYACLACLHDSFSCAVVRQTKEHRASDSTFATMLMRRGTLDQSLASFQPGNTFHVSDFWSLPPNHPYYTGSFRFRTTRASHPDAAIIRIRRQSRVRVDDSNGLLVQPLRCFELAHADGAVKEYNSIISTIPPQLGHRERCREGFHPIHWHPSDPTELRNWYAWASSVTASLFSTGRRS